MELPELKPADLFQFAFLITRETTRLIGPRPPQEIIARLGLEKLFSIEAAGALNTNFPPEDPKVREYYHGLLTGIELALKNTFGESFTKNLLEQNLNKLKSWMP